MNIFVLDIDTRRCAAWHCDKHITKMPLEATQLLCTAINLAGGTTPYKTAHRNHPCAIWARQTQTNFIWLAELGYELCTEYTRRYHKTHKCANVIDTCLTQSNLLPAGPLTPFPQAMPDKYKHNNPVQAYRAYYLGDKKDIANWNHSPGPPWWAFKTTKRLTQNIRQRIKDTTMRLEQAINMILRDLDESLTAQQNDDGTWQPTIDVADDVDLHTHLNGYFNILFFPYTFKADDPKWYRKMKNGNKLTPEFAEAIRKAKEAITRVDTDPKIKKKKRGL